MANCPVLLFSSVEAIARSCARPAEMPSAFRCHKRRAEAKCGCVNARPANWTNVALRTQPTVKTAVFVCIVTGRENAKRWFAAPKRRNHLLLVPDNVRNRNLLDAALDKLLDELRKLEEI